jgi:predicted secreted Zn-dependent protease
MQAFPFLHPSCRPYAGKYLMHNYIPSAHKSCREIENLWHELGAAVRWHTAHHQNKIKEMLHSTETGSLKW